MAARASDFSSLRKWLSTALSRSLRLANRRSSTPVGRARSRTEKPLAAGSAPRLNGPYAEERKPEPAYSLAICGIATYGGMLLRGPYSWETTEPKLGY